MRWLRRFFNWLNARETDPEAIEAAAKVKFDHETIKTGAFDAPPMMQGQKWPRD